MESWQLPEHIADVLASDALYLERMRSLLLHLFYTHGYQLIFPPLIEYAETLLINKKDEGLKKRTIYFTDQLSGALLGVRADTTPQISRIDAHLSKNGELRRFCYAVPSLHALPSSLFANREPLQVLSLIHI